MIVASAVLSQHTRVTDDDRQHLTPIAESAMQLQRSAETITNTNNYANILFIYVRFTAVDV